MNNSAQPARFRKRPVVIEAMQLDGTLKRARDIAAWANQDGKVNCYVTPMLGRADSHRLTVRTLEGDMIASAPDYVVKGVKGEFYPVKEDIFDMTYEAVE